MVAIGSVAKAWSGRSAVAGPYRALSEAIGMTINHWLFTITFAVPYKGKETNILA
jgi:hypothetical protein